MLHFYDEPVADGIAFPEKADKVNLSIEICTRLACQRFESGTSEAAAFALSPDGSGILPQRSDGR